jgi:shikimate kinase
VLVGMMGTGKSTVGRRLATQLGRPFLDSDEMIEARTGHTVKELFERDGEAGFRAEESKALADALGRPAPGVIAAAGGTVLDSANRDGMKRVSAAGGLVVWLQADPAVLAARVAHGSHRPLLADDPLGTLTRLAAERDALYHDVADLEIDTEAGPAAVIDRIVTTVSGPDADSVPEPVTPGPRP